MNNDLLYLNRLNVLIVNLSSCKIIDTIEETSLRKGDFKKTKMENKFTLIELIIVISIIAILVSILLPALNSTRKKAKSIACVSNVKQLAYGCLSYADTYDSYIYPHKYHSAWYQKLEALDFIKRTINKCPSSDQTVGYGMNACYFYSDKFSRLGGIKNPSLLFMIGDWKYHGAVYGFSYLDTLYIPDFRHTKRMNVGCVDGHVESVILMDFPDTSSHPNTKRLWP